jgi:hypothetical protein
MVLPKAAEYAADVTDPRSAPVSRSGKAAAMADKSTSASRINFLDCARRICTLAARSCRQRITLHQDSTTSVKGMASKSPTSCCPQYARGLTLQTDRYILRSNRPALKRDGSSSSGRLVAPNTNTCWSDLPPAEAESDGRDEESVSISVSNCETTRSITPPPSEPLPRAGASESNSSKNRMEGATALALWNSSRTFFSLSPT